MILFTLTMVASVIGIVGIGIYLYVLLTDDSDYGEDD